MTDPISPTEAKEALAAAQNSFGAAKRSLAFTRGEALAHAILEGLGTALLPFTLTATWTALGSTLHLGLLAATFVLAAAYTLLRRAIWRGRGAIPAPAAGAMVLHVVQITATVGAYLALRSFGWIWAPMAFGFIAAAARLISNEVRLRGER